MRAAPEEDLAISAPCAGGKAPQLLGSLDSHPPPIPAMSSKRIETPPGDRQTLLLLRRDPDPLGGAGGKKEAFGWGLGLAQEGAEKAQSVEETAPGSVGNLIRCPLWEA